MNGTLIKKVVEEKVQVSENKYENQVQITFETSKQNAPVKETITLAGEGTLKVLMPV